MAFFVKENQNTYTNIILDMDETLLGHTLQPFEENKYNIQMTPIARPYLHGFLEYVFTRFERVSIWTAAGQRWYDECYDKVLRHYIPEGKKFHFVKTRSLIKIYVPTKKLTEIYTDYPEYNSSNTLIIDDNPMTYIDNVENAIGIEPFCYDLMDEKTRQTDQALLRTIERLECILNGEDYDEL